MLSFIMLSTFIWFTFLILYYLLLRRETYFRYNRLYLLISLLLGVFVPLLPVIHYDKEITKVIAPVVIQLPEFYFSYKIVNEHNNSSSDTLILIVFFVYFLGFIYQLFLFIKSLMHIKKFIDTGEKLIIDRYKIIVLDKPVMPFSFFNKIFIGKENYYSKEKEKILIHEFAHIGQKHSYDNIFIATMKILFWFNPLIYIYQRFLKETHEYEADNQVLKYTTKYSYGELLINQLQQGLQLGIANYFINSLIKKRIKMMYQKKSNGKWKYLLMFPVLLLIVFFVNACKTSKDTAKKSAENRSEYYELEFKNNEKKKQKDKKVFQIVEQMPHFPGCENLKTEQERTNCSTKKFMEYVYSNLEYPEIAQKHNLKGRVIARFIVNSKGNIENVKILRDIGGGCGDEVKRVIESMNKNNITWEPGKQKGKSVDVYYTLPVIFKFDKPIKTK